MDSERTKIVDPEVCRRADDAAIMYVCVSECLCHVCHNVNLVMRLDCRKRVRRSERSGFQRPWESGLGGSLLGFTGATVCDNGCAD